MKPKDPKPYEVGRGKPPKHAQFKKGQSGNPSGRPKGALNRASLIAQVLAEKVTVTENGRRRTITKFEAAVKQAVHRAISGDPRAIDQVMRMSQALDAQAAEPLGSAFREADLAVMESLAGRMKAQLAPQPEGERDE